MDGSQECLIFLANFQGDPGFAEKPLKGPTKSAAPAIEE
jgi:hypothetical protein